MSDSESLPLLRSRHATYETPGMRRNFSIRAVIAGMLIGILVNLSNTYYGLIAGTSQQMPIVSALLGYLVFNLLTRAGFQPLSKAENVLIVSTATATGCMPVTAGIAELFPALEYVLEPVDGGPLPLSWADMILWSLGLCLFGIIFAALLRKRLVIPQDMPWPGATASSNIIKALHVRVQEPSTPDAAGPVAIEESHRGLSIILKSAGVSMFITVAMSFIPISRNIPILGPDAAQQWLWSFTISPGFFGGGMIMGPEITLHMLTGAIVAWACLSPLAKSQGWAPGPIDDWDTGSRGWIVWISLSALIADAVVKIGWICMRPLLSIQGSEVSSKIRLYSQELMGWLKRKNRYSPWYTGVSGGTQEIERNQDPQSTSAWELTCGSTGRYFLGLGFLVSILICTGTTTYVFRSQIPWYYVLLSVLLALPMAVVSIRTLGESDYNPQSGLVSQLFFASIMPRSRRNAVVVNIISAAISTAGASQTGDLAYDFKIGNLVGGSPTAQIYGQTIGSVFGAVVSCITYRLYVSRFQIPGPIFQIPSSFLVISTAKLVLGKGLPEGAPNFALGFGIFFMIATMVKMRYADQWWQKFVPSGVSFAVGIFLLPAYTLSRCAGGLFAWIWIIKAPSRKSAVEVIGSGLILGEAIGSLADLALTALEVPQYGPRYRAIPK